MRVIAFRSPAVWLVQTNGNVAFRQFWVCLKILWKTLMLWKCQYYLYNIYTYLNEGVNVSVKIGVAKNNPSLKFVYFLRLLLITSISFSPQSCCGKYVGIRFKCLYFC